MHQRIGRRRGLVLFALSDALVRDYVGDTTVSQSKMQRGGSAHTTTTAKEKTTAKVKVRSRFSYLLYMLSLYVEAFSHSGRRIEITKSPVCRISVWYVRKTTNSPFLFLTSQNPLHSTRDECTTTSNG